MPSSLRNRKVLVSSTVGLLLVGYLILSFSPMKYEIGRHNPLLASFLSPPMFNFMGHYHDGRVLGFEIGMPRQEIAEALLAEYLENGHVVANCQVVTGRSLVPIVDEQMFLEVVATSRTFCAHIADAPLGMRFIVPADILKEIEVWYVNLEGT